MIHNIHTDPDSIFIPVTLYAPLSNDQMQRVKQEIDTVHAGIHHHIHFWVQDEILTIATPAEHNQISSSSLREFAELVSVINDTEDDQTPFIFCLLLISSYLNAKSAKSSKRLRDDTAAMVELFADMVIYAGYPTADLLDNCCTIFEKITLNAPDVELKADFEAHIVQRKMEN